MDNPYPATTERRKSTALTWRQSEGEREAERWKQGDKRDIPPLRTTWIQIQKCCPKADLPLVCWGMDSRDQNLTLHFRRVGRTRGDRESVMSSVLDCILRGKCEHSLKYKKKFNSVTACYVLLCTWGRLCTCSVSLFCYSVYRSLPAALSKSYFLFLPSWCRVV